MRYRSRKKKKRLLRLLIIAAVIVFAALGAASVYYVKQEQAREEQRAQELIRQQKEQEAAEKAAEERAAREEAERQAAIEKKKKVDELLKKQEEERLAALNGREGLSDLKEGIEGYLNNWAGDWSVYVYNLDTNEYLDINSHPMKAASLIKLYIMGSIYEKIQAGELTKDEEIMNLLTQMITVSHNESSNELVRRLSADGTNHEEGMTVVNAFAENHGFAHTSQGRDLRDFREVPAQGENYTSARDCGMLLRDIYRGSLISEDASKEMLDLLKRQERTWKIPQGLPQGVVCANKTGELSDTENDAAIVFGEKVDYVVCVMSQGLSDTAAAQQNIRDLSTYIYQYFHN